MENKKSAKEILTLIELMSYKLVAIQPKNSGAIIDNRIQKATVPTTLPV